MPPEAAVAILEGLRGSQTDPAVHDALLSVLRRQRAGGGSSVPSPAA
jgi:hypothetical protein